jgi:hypothetical protein
LLIPPQIDLPATYLADWIELYATSTEYQTCPLEKLWDAVEISGDEFPSGEEEDVCKEQLLGRTYRELERRIEALEEAYPYKISKGGSSIIHVPVGDQTPGMLAYNLSLRISINCAGVVADDTIPKITPHERNLFQACANLAAAGYLGGRVYAFGWPRPDRTSLLSALKKVEEAMGGEGILKTSPPEVAKYAKDDELDVFAWLPHCDGPGWALTLWGQVASGRNWSEKPLSTDKIDQFRRRWYQNPPALKPIRAMFVPFCLFEEELEKGFEDYKAKLFDQTVIFGMLFHRSRLPRYMQKAFDIPAEIEGMVTMDKQAVFSELKSWWIKFIGKIQNNSKA